MFSIWSGNKCLETCVLESEKDFALEAWRGIGWENVEARPMVESKEFRTIDEIEAEKKWKASAIADVGGDFLSMGEA